MHSSITLLAAPQKMDVRREQTCETKFEAVKLVQVSDESGMDHSDDSGVKWTIQETLRR